MCVYVFDRFYMCVWIRKIGRFYMCMYLAASLEWLLNLTKKKKKFAGKK